mgnify:CR=1 FL=1|tara:strand:- start:526 stop:978 length:453 start_codon:yes stop_codon:yes gene_type:complete
MTKPICQEAVDLVKRFEGFSSTVYLCPAFKFTRGYGFIRLSDGSRVKKDTPPISKEEAEEQLAEELSVFARGVDRLVKVPINEQQRGSLTSFAFNLGLGSLKSSTLLRRVNDPDDWDDVPNQFLRWVYAGGKRLRGLELRRAAEADLWLS